MLLGQEVHYYMVYIAYFTELKLRICDYAQKRRICRENCKYALDEKFHGHFCPRRKAAKFCHPVLQNYALLGLASIQLQGIDTIQFRIILLIFVTTDVHMLSKKKAP